MTGEHKYGFGWNAHGVFCGECNRDDCKGCLNEQKVWEEPYEEIIKHIRDEDKRLEHKRKLVADKLADNLTQLYKSFISTGDIHHTFNEYNYNNGTNY